MHEALRLHDAILEEETTKNAGAVFKRVGDGFCTAFQLPRNAISAAVAAQRRLRGGPWPENTARLRVRVGVHTGSALAESDDYFGPSLNRVARLMSAGHGGQILVSSSAAAVLRDDGCQGAALRELGTYHLKDLSEPETIFQVVADGIDTTFPGLNTLDSHPNNLPLQISSFVGRDKELRDLENLLQDHRLITIAGPGGIGKTRLLLQLAAEKVGGFKDGVWFVALSAITDPSLVVAATAAALRLSEVPQESHEETLIRNLTPLELLLAFDNAEQVRASANSLVRKILERAPRVRVVVTSREPLHLRGEQVYRLEALPDEESIRLFCERAREVAHGFAPMEADAGLVAAISRQLQGIPLALELAAARTATLSLDQIQARLDRQLAFLTAPALPDEDRHRTLRGTIAWSYDLLSSDERALLGTLSVFADSFTLEAVEALTPEAQGTLDLVSSLVDKSLVSVRKIEGLLPRYQLLEAIRSYAEGEALPALVLSARKKHAGFYLAIATKGNEALPHEELAGWLRAVDADSANIRAALSFGFEQDDNTLGRALCGMWRYWYLRRRFTEGRAWLDRFVQSSKQDVTTLAPVLRHLSSFACLQHDYDCAAEFAHRALDLYERLKDSAGCLAAKNALAVNEYRRGNLIEAEKLYNEIAKSSMDAGGSYALVLALRNLATLKLFDNRLTEAKPLLVSCRLYAEKLGDAEQLSTVDGLEGSLAYEQGDYETAEKKFTSALEAKQHLGNEFGAAEIALGLASVRLAQCKLYDARRLILSTLAASLNVESADLAANGLEALAELRVARGDWDLAFRLFVDAALIRRAHCHAYSTKLGKRRLTDQLSAHYGAEVAMQIEAARPLEWKTAVEGWLQASTAEQDDLAT